MKQQEINSIASNIRHSGAWLIVLFISSFMMLTPACQHEPDGTPIDPGPIDTTENPIDTTENPVDTSGVPCDPAKVYFATDVLPILKSNCAKAGCHDAVSQQEGIILESFQSIFNSDEDNLIVPFNLNESKLFEVITESDPDKLMPQPPNQRLTADQINTIATWILQGAQDLTCDPNTGSCDTENVSFSGFVAPLLANNCVGCHSGGAPSGGITLNTHGGVQAVANNGRLYGAISHASGFQPMPRGSAKLPQCTIDKINGWIQDGALNN